MPDFLNCSTEFFIPYFFLNFDHFFSPLGVRLQTWGGRIKPLKVGREGATIWPKTFQNEQKKKKTRNLIFDFIPIYTETTLAVTKKG